MSAFAAAGPVLAAGGLAYGAMEAGHAAYTSWSALNPAKAKVVDHIAGDLAKRAYEYAVPKPKRGGVRGAVYSYARKGYSAYRDYHRARYTTRRKRWTKMRKSLGKFARRWRFGRGADARTRWRNTIHRLRPNLSRYVYV